MKINALKSFDFTNVEVTHGTEKTAVVSLLMYFILGELEDSE